MYWQASVPIADELPIELESAISPLSLLDDEELWRGRAQQAFQLKLPSSLKS